MRDYFIPYLARGRRVRDGEEEGVIMREKPRQKTLDENTEEVRGKRRMQSAQEAVPEQAPLKEHGQPAWRDVKKD